MTSGLKKSMKTRDKLYKKWLLTHDLIWHTKYKLYRNKIVSINKYYREIYYNTVLTNSNNIKKMWDNINYIINKKRPSSHIEEISVNNKKYHQPSSIANHLNNYFCNVASDLATSLPKSNRHFKSYLTQYKEKLSFTQVSEVEVFLLLENLDRKKSFGIDKVHPFLLSVGALEITKPLTHLINLSLIQGKFPDSLKVAKVVPVFKQGSHMLCTNYRPISVLPALSKIFEKCVLNQLMFYITFHDIFAPNQYGFRSGKNTTDCLVDLLEQINKSIDNGEFAVTLFLDLSKAFDTVNHSILLSKLSYYGIIGLENLWFKSYLQQRRQTVYVNGVFSDIQAIKLGVPQGSVLGPILFLIYINDFSRASSYFSTRLFADDTSLTACGKDLDSLIHHINNELPKIYDWLCANKLTINLTKTKYIIFQPKQKLNSNLHLPIVLAGQPLDYSFSVKYLGLIIDCHLSWHDHIEYICSKISKNINIMIKVKRLVSKVTIINMYYSFIYPYLTYGSILWGNNYYSPIYDVVKLQNKAIRVINDVPIMDNITPHYVNLSILKFPDIVKLHTCLYFLMFYVITNPPIL